MNGRLLMEITEIFCFNMPTKLTPHEPRTPQEAAINAILTAPMKTEADRLALVEMLDDIGDEWQTIDTPAEND